MTLIPGNASSELDDRDIWLTANLLIKRFGNDALLESATRVEELHASGDPAGARVWRRIQESIEFLTEGTTTALHH